jgi:hypothetical protein
MMMFFTKLFEFVGVRGLIIGGLSIALAFGMYQNSELSDDLITARLEITEKDTKIKGLEASVNDLNLKIERTRKQGVTSYNAAQISCDRRIESAVDAVSAPVFNPTPEVPPNAPDGSPPVCDCPSVRMRDITKPFGIE